MTLYEQETNINFNAEECEAVIYTAYKPMMRKLDKLLDRGEVSVVSEDQYGKTYRLPKKWIKVRPNRILSEAQKAEYAERARKVLYHNLHK